MNNFFYLIINNCLNNKYKNYFEILKIIFLMKLKNLLK